MENTKYIFITGGVVSSLGKGIIAASLAKLLQARGFKIAIQKLDPYLNVDPGTMNPCEHGECYVTDDGAETDLDLGHYERFLNIPTSALNSVTTGKIYSSVIQKERKGDYLGKTVQVIPHITNEIQAKIKEVAQHNKPDFLIVEIGGTVGDIESLPYLEAIRQLRWELPAQNTLSIHLTLVPFLQSAGELKTKPTQHSVKQLSEIGLRPDIVVCRTEHTLSADIKAKIALFCNVDRNSVIEAKDAKTIYEVPLLMQAEGLDAVVLHKMGFTTFPATNLTQWNAFLEALAYPTKAYRIALVGKYELKDAYKSILEAMIHAGAKNKVHAQVDYIHAENIKTENMSDLFKSYDGVIVGPGFGERGIEEKMDIIRYCRENKIPILGICLGMQCMVIEFARNILGLKGAHSTEMDPKTPYPVIDMMEEQKKITHKGGTMRLGAYPCKITKPSLAFEAYQNENISERHRHRWELHNEYLPQMQAKGLHATGINPTTNLVEIVELDAAVHPFFLGAQYHPEYKSTVENPHPLFVYFMKKIIETGR